MGLDRSYIGKFLLISLGTRWAGILGKHSLTWGEATMTRKLIDRIEALVEDHNDGGPSCGIGFLDNIDHHLFQCITSTLCATNLLW